MRKYNRIIAFILVLVISLSSVLVQTFALDELPTPKSIDMEVVSELSKQFWPYTWPLSITGLHL